MPASLLCNQNFRFYRFFTHEWHVTRTCVVYMKWKHMHVSWYSFHNGSAPLQTGWGGEELMNKVVIFVFFMHKKYSHSSITLQLNPWCHMDYFIDVLATFLELGTFQLHCCLWRVRELSDVIKNIFICVSKTNESLTGFGTTWGWVINDRIFIFGWTNIKFHLSHFCCVIHASRSGGWCRTYV